MSTLDNQKLKYNESYKHQRFGDGLSTQTRPHGQIVGNQRWYKTYDQKDEERRGQGRTGSAWYGNRGS